MSELKPQKYKDNRPPEYFQQFHERSRTKDPKFVYGLVRAALTPIALGFYRAKAIGTENVPAEGPVLLAPNHFSNMDHFFAGVYLRRQIRFMAKSQLFGPPVLTSIFTHGGVFPVRRGHRDDEAFTTVYRIFENGGAVLVSAEGGRSRSGGLGDPKPGIGRIALESGVPVVPVAIRGSSGVRNINKLRFPKVTIQFGQPMSFPAIADATKEQQMEVSNAVFDQVKLMYTGIDELGVKGVRQKLKDALPAPEPDASRL